MPQLYHFVAEQFKENLVLGDGQAQQHMVAGRLCQYLKTWQLDGLRFLYKNHEKGEGCILNDESGLGKVVTVATFLGTILTNDTTKKCLIVVRDEAAIEEWRFHLGVLTHLTVKVIEKSTDINFETVYLIKWSSLKDIVDIDKCTFNHVILDNRGEMLNNKFCSGILLRYFENKTSIIISSVDVTSDIKLLHILLRLCGRLERQYSDARVFEDKFQLPQLQEGVSTKVDLEDYFVKREKVINFCREFRLRRYCHQFDEELPIVSRMIFQRHLQQWQEQNKNSLSSGSVKNERNNKSNRLVDYEVQQINEMPSLMDFDDAAENSSDDVVVMSPLLVVTDSESDDENNRTLLQDEEIKDEEENDCGKKTSSKDSINIPTTNRRKSKTPVKTPPNVNKNNYVEDDKRLRSRAKVSPKKPLPIRTNSRKQDKDSEKQLSLKEITKKSEEKTKAIKEISNNEKSLHVTPKQLVGKSPNKDETLSKKSKPEESPKQKDKETRNLEKSESIDKTQTPTKSARVKLRPLKPDDKRETSKEEVTKSSKETIKTGESNKKTSPNSDKVQKKVTIEENEKTSETLNMILDKPSMTSFKMMLEEAQKFVSNENIGRRSTKAATTKIRSKKLEVPKVILVKGKVSERSKNIDSTTSNDSKSVETAVENISSLSNESKRTSNKKEIINKPPASNKNKSPSAKPKVTELIPLGVHSISTRGMQRATRSHPSTNKYMKISIEQVDTTKLTLPKCLIRRRSVCVPREDPPEQTETKTPSKTAKKDKPPSPTPSAISVSPDESIQLGQALTQSNNFVVPEVVAPPPSYNFPSMPDKEISDSECQITSETINNQEIIVLSGSSIAEREMEPPKSTISRRKIGRITARPPMVTIPRPVFSKAKSPDLFSTCSDVSLPCSQQHTVKKQFEGFKIFGSELRQPVKQQRSCLDILERMLEPRNCVVAQKKNTPANFFNKPTTSHQHCIDDEDAMFEITANGTFGSSVRVNSNGEMSPIRQKNQSTPPSSGHPKNRITNYFNNGNQQTGILGQSLSSSLEDVSDLLPKTPKRRKSLSGSGKRSPRSLSSTSTTGKSQSTKLTEWLVKNSNGNGAESTTKLPSTKRRRLDLSFPDK